MRMNSQHCGSHCFTWPDLNTHPVQRLEPPIIGDDFNPQLLENFISALQSCLMTLKPLETQALLPVHVLARGKTSQTSGFFRCHQLQVRTRILQSQRRNTSCFSNYSVFHRESLSGFYFIAEALIIEEQCGWIRENSTSFPQPPNRTNHNAIYGNLKFCKWQMKLLEYQFKPTNCSICSFAEVEVEYPCTGIRLVKELQERESRYKRLSPMLDCTQISWDMLGGYVDDMEADWSKPIVSIRYVEKWVKMTGVFLLESIISKILHQKKLILCSRLQCRP
ncbi:hypothetical protein NE237_020460 [Protea cynaroides]|uniref:Uncharacterized protein n=1 Tax=Protea cynaroides TaxID=273540 RepID=A0A9Q0H9F7_9MAGN|nr:hypothetical protein NE237_020460 [Protea cynaroides]